MMWISLAPLADRLNQGPLHEVDQRALADLCFEGVLVDRPFFFLVLDLQAIRIQELQKLVLRGDDLFEEIAEVFQPAVADLVFLAEVAGDERDAPVGGIRRDDDQLVGLLLIVLERNHLGLDQHLPQVGGKGVHEAPDEIDADFVDLLVLEIDLPERVEVGNFPEDRIVIGTEIVDQNLP